MITVRRTGAVGDSVAATIVADKLAEQGYEVCWQTHPNIQPVIKLHPTISEVTAPEGVVDVNLDATYENDPRRRLIHFHELFIGAANRQLAAMGIGLPDSNCHPRLRRPESPARELLSVHPKPWVFICPRSNDYAVRQVPDGIWCEAAEKIKGTKFWLGTHPSPPGIYDLRCRTLLFVAQFLAAADLLVTVDTGPMHIAAAFGIPIVAIGQSNSPALRLSKGADFSVIEPPLFCLNCQKNLCPISPIIPPCQHIDPWAIAEAVNKKLASPPVGA